jgi:ribosomal protein L16 Arg81 hydroxylase
VRGHGKARVREWPAKVYVSAPPASSLPARGYVFKGKMTARYADHDEVFEAGDACYIPPGHVPVKNEPGTEILWFSPSGELRTAEAAMMKNMQAMQDGSTP